MSPEAMCVLVGACCALCASLPCMMWVRQEDKRVKAEQERDKARGELNEAHRTIMALHGQLGLTKTTVAPWMRKG